MMGAMLRKLTNEQTCLVSWMPCRLEATGPRKAPLVTTGHGECGEGLAQPNTAQEARGRSQTGDPSGLCTGTKPPPPPRTARPSEILPHRNGTPWKRNVSILSSAREHESMLWERDGKEAPLNGAWVRGRTHKMAARHLEDKGCEVKEPWEDSLVTWFDMEAAEESNVALGDDGDKSGWGEEVGWPQRTRGLAG